MSLLVHAVVPERGLDLELEIEPGQTVALLGPNGAGKSTLLDVVAGHHRSPGVRVELDGRTLTGPRAWVAPHDRGVGLLAQEPLLFPHLTVGANVGFGPRARGVARNETRRVVRQWLERVGCADLAGRRATRLSGGQAQRVAIARALAVDPAVVLLDEPMAALDVDSRPPLRQVLREVLAGRTAMIATHDVLDALLLADRVVVLEGGRLVEDGPVADVLTRPRSAFAARVAGLNLVTGLWNGDALAGEWFVSGVGREGLAVGGAAVAAFRPSAVSVFAAAPEGSPRNAWPVVVTAVEPSGDQIRVVAGALSALVTPQAAAELRLAPGAEVAFVVKANEVEIYPR